MMFRDRSLGVISAFPCYRHNGVVRISTTLGRIVDGLAERFQCIRLCVPVQDGEPAATADHVLNAPNLELAPQPFYKTTFEAQRHLRALAQCYSRLIQASDVVFVRGLCAMIPWIYGSAWRHRRPICHWIVGDPVAVVQTDYRSGRLRALASRFYAHADRWATIFGRRLADGWFLCNGQPLGAIYRSPRTIVTSSSIISEREVFHREDTCQGDTIRMLYVGQIRPEKGLEYLVEAVARLNWDRPWDVELIGAADRFPEYDRAIRDRIAAHGYTDRFHFRGHVAFGPDLFRYYREADLFVFPSLSEGTPHVLSEAMANGVPIVTTNVGGIPTSVTDRVNAVLVAPHDPDALANGIRQVISDREFRRSLIRCGYETVRMITVEKFVELIAGIFNNQGLRHD